jgi:hypothetical protein
MKNINLFLAILISLVVTACGGGGGNNLGSSAPTTPLNISATNQLDITRAALNYAIAGSPIDVFTTKDLLDVLSNTPCTNSAAGGNMLFIPTTLTNFTSGTISFFNCTLASGRNFNGRLSFSSLTTTPPSNPINLINPDSISIRLGLDSLTVTKTRPITLLGDYNLNIAGLNTYLVTTTITSPVGTSLRVSSSITETISNLNNSNALNFGISSTDNNSFTLASSVLGGQISCTTSTPFFTNIGLGKIFPYPGVLIITSTLNSNQLRITASGDFPSSLVQVELSTNGGGAYNPQVTYTWAELFP